MVVADTHEKAKLAASKVQIQYEDLPPILSIEDAISAKSFHPNSEKILRKGDVDLCFQSGQCYKIVEGEVQVGGQEHFYLEPQSTLIWSVDGGNEVHMVSSTQVSNSHFLKLVLNFEVPRLPVDTARLNIYMRRLLRSTRSMFLVSLVFLCRKWFVRPRDLVVGLEGRRQDRLFLLP